MTVGAFTNDSATLDARQLRAVEALAEGGSLGAAARAAGVAPSTLWRWRSKPAFLAALREARDAAFGKGVEAPRLALPDAVKTCRALMASRQRPEIRLKAAAALLGHALRAHEAVNVEERLAALEARAGGAR